MAWACPSSRTPATAARKLFPKARLTAADLDPIAVKVAVENAWLNGVPTGRGPGAITLLACDVVGRVIGGQAEVPVGVVLATLGGVAFVVIVRRTKLAAL